jgi:hypothetical protein
MRNCYQAIDLQLGEMKTVMLVLLFRALFIPFTVAQLPVPSRTHTRLGACNPFATHLLGSQEVAAQAGLVAQQLTIEAQTTFRNTRYFTTVIPRVSILGATITCASFGPTRDTYGTVALLVNYRCIGVACIHAMNVEGGDDVYTHQFAFACNPANNLWTHYNITGRRAHTNRDVTSTIQTVSTAVDGQCATCTSDVQFDVIPRESEFGNRFDEATGCISKLFFQSIISKGTYPNDSAKY